MLAHIPRQIMNQTFFPNKIIQIIFLLVLSLLLASPAFLLFETNQLVSRNIFTTLFFILFCSVFIGIVIFKNHKRHKVIDLNFKLINRKSLIKSSFIVVMLSIGFIKPINILIHKLTDSELLVNNPFDNIWMVLGAISLAPFFEELILRGIILRGL